MISAKLLRVLRTNRSLIRDFSEVKSSTIYALSSGRGKCGVAVIRVSGPRAAHALRAVLATSTLPKPRYAHLKRIKHPTTSETLDQGLVLWFPGPKSFTGEDCFELQVHGGVAVVSSVLNALGSVPGLRLARPGEFTRKAFFNGKMDLTEVEGLADLIHAETEAQRKQALLQAHGCLSRVYTRWREVLVRCLAHVEAYIDFDETDSLEGGIMGEVGGEVEKLKGEIQRHLEDGRRGERLRCGVKTVILGEPNVGKSSLFNALSRKPAAIVTPIAGTTRDVLEVTLDIGGYPVVLTDTAGLRSDTTDLIEKEGINRALLSYETADLIIIVLDAQKFVTWSKLTNKNDPNEFLNHSLHNVILDHQLRKKEHVIVLNKTDLIENTKLAHKNFIPISCKTEQNFSVLLDALTEKLKNLCGTPTEHISMNQARHRQHLTDCLKKLEEFSKARSCGDCDAAILAEHLRVALRHLGMLTGAVANEEVLDVIFRDFCIGK